MRALQTKRHRAGLSTGGLAAAGLLLAAVFSGWMLADEGTSPPAPRGMTATAGRGTIRVYASDERGELVSKGEPPNAVYVEEARPVRWVVCVGTFDHRGARAGLRALDGEGSSAKKPVYRRLEVERRERAGGAAQWSEWQPLDARPTRRILDFISEIEAEPAIAPFVVKPLAEDLPYLTSGKWLGTSVARLERTDEEQKAAGNSGRPRNLDGVLGTSKPELLVRFFDFGIQPGRWYRYRCRMVFEDPREREPAKRELFGPWSEATNEAMTAE